MRNKIEDLINYLKDKNDIDNLDYVIKNKKEYINLVTIKEQLDNYNFE